MDNLKPIIAKDNEHLKQLIKEHVKKYGKECSLNHIDVSPITDMSHLFKELKFNGDISKWDTSNVIDMNIMFYSSQFNGDIFKWNTQNVINLDFMFFESSFNQDIYQWDIKSLNDSVDMFLECKNDFIPEWANKNNQEILEYKNSLSLKNDMDSSLNNKTNDKQQKLKI